MSSIDDELITVIKGLAKTIKKVGVKKVVAALDELNTEEDFIEAHKSLIKYILRETSQQFKVSSEDLKRKNIRGTTVDARAMCFVLLKKHLDLKHTDIAKIFGSSWVPSTIECDASICSVSVDPALGNPSMKIGSLSLQPQSFFISNKSLEQTLI